MAKEEGSELSALSGVASLEGVDSSLAKKLAKLKLHRIFDLALHFPNRFQDFTRLTPLSELAPGRAAVFEATVVKAEIKYGRKTRSFAATLEDDFGVIVIRYFRVFPWLKKILVEGRRIRCFGKPYRHRALEMSHPRIEVLDKGAKPLPEFLEPVYPLTAGVSQERLGKLINKALKVIAGDQALNRTSLIPGAPEWIEPLPAALDKIHKVRSWQESQDLLRRKHPAMRSVIFHDILANLYALEGMRARLRERPGLAIEYDKESLGKLAQDWPFRLTDAQKRAIDGIAKDIAKPRAMLRLLQGDVGSGKTAVAAFIIYLCRLSDCQVALLAPTEILCEQHLETFAEWFSEPGQLRVELLTSSIKGKAREGILARINAGEVDLVIGTHALFQGNVSFRRLGLIIVDEQQRFGVEHRSQLAQKAQGGKDQPTPHQLMMTATPIPRTLGTAKLSILDCSVLDQMPEGRSQVRTSIMPDDRRADLIERVREYVADSKQVFWVSPRIEEGEEDDELQSVKAIEKILAREIGSEQIRVVHGRLKVAERERIIGAFRNKGFPILVATTVVEVGVDIPNATLMVIEHCERLGLSQIHQLRGRVGRGHKISDCILLYHKPISEISQQRLLAARSTNGFELAKKDLELRGAGEFFGTEQSGTLNMRVGNLFRDEEMLAAAHSLAKKLAKEDPERGRDMVGLWIGDRIDESLAAI